MLLNLQTSPGEFLDRLTILEIKSERIADPAKLANVRRELELLRATWAASPLAARDVSALLAGLRAANEALWEVEDRLRACEAELGAVMGHEAGPMPPYEELFASGKGFTDVDEARRFVQESGCDWLSVAIGNIHGAISGAAKDAKKVTARLNNDHLRAISAAGAVQITPATPSIACSSRLALF